MSEHVPQGKMLLSKDQIQKRVKELGKQISDDYRGKTVCAICVLENAFMFMSDLIRELEVPVLCQFMKPEFTEKYQGSTATTEIFFTPELRVEGKDVLLVEGLVQSGVTTEFLLRNLQARGAASVKLAVFLDKQAERRISLQPDYFGFMVDESFLVGYGLGSPHLNRNLPYVMAQSSASAVSGK
jgi:hypoxanthine phosphoribosyltransferase